MIDFLSKSISKIFSSKTESDYKKLAPIIDEVNAVAENLKSLSNDELRNKTLEFRKTITEYLADTDAELNQLNEEAESNQKWMQPKRKTCIRALMH